MEEGDATKRLTKTVRTGGYIIEAGSILGFSMGIYFLFNHALFGSLFRIGQTEVTSYFIGVFMPSFIVLAVIGYLFVTPSSLKRTDLSNVLSLCVMSFIVIVLSMFSILYFVSLAGGFLVLAASVMAFTKPTFRTLSKVETFLMVELGAMLVASSSTMFLLMHLASGFFQTYSPSSYGGYVIYTLTTVMFLSFFTFFGVPLLGSRGTHAGVSGTLGLVTTTLSLALITQNQYAFFSMPALLGFTVLVLGFSLSMFGNLGYLWLFLFEIVATDVFSVSPLDRGKYCPYCGTPRLTLVQRVCSSCGRSLTWTPYAPFCSDCGLIIPANAHACPHCKEDLSSKRIYFYGQTAQHKASLDRATEKLRQQNTWTAKAQLFILLGLKRIVTLGYKFGKLLLNVGEKLSLTLKDAIFIVIMCYAFNFLAFITYVRYGTVIIGIATETEARFHGFPVEWVVIKAAGFPPAEVNWAALVLDVIFFLLIATLIATVVAKLVRRSQ